METDWINLRAIGAEFRLQQSHGIGPSGEPESLLRDLVNINLGQPVDKYCPGQGFFCF